MKAKVLGAALAAALVLPMAAAEAQWVFLAR